MEIKEILEKIGLPFAYRKFKPYKNKPLPEPPYIVWYIDDEQDFGSDDKNFLKRQKISFELYSRNKDRTNEAKIEEALNFVRFNKWEEYIESEKLYFVLYEFEIIIKIGGNNNGYE